MYNSSQFEELLTKETRFTHTLYKMARLGAHVAQQGSVATCNSSIPSGHRLNVPAALLLTLLPANGLGEAAGDSQVFGPLPPTRCT